jgi:hypothetical protein
VTPKAVHTTESEYEKYIAYQKLQAKNEDAKKDVLANS